MRASYVMFKWGENILYLYDTLTFNLQNRSIKQPTWLTLHYLNHLSLLHAKMPKYELIMGRQAPKGRRWPCLGIIIIHWAKRCPFWGSCNLPHVPKKPSTLPHAPENVQAALGGVLIIKVNVPTAGGWSPWARSMPKRPDEGVLLLLCARAHHKSILPLPSQQPPDGLFIPM